MICGIVCWLLPDMEQAYRSTQWIVPECYNLGMDMKEFGRLGGLSRAKKLKKKTDKRSHKWEQRHAGGKG